MCRCGNFVIFKTVFLCVFSEFFGNCVVGYYVGFVSDNYLRTGREQFAEIFQFLVYRLIIFNWVSSFAS